VHAGQRFNGCALHGWHLVSLDAERRPLRFAVSAEAERPQLAVCNSIEHATADVVLVQLGQAQPAARDRRRFTLAK
jgi:hypothetical protein